MRRPPDLNPVRSALFYETALMIPVHVEQEFNAYDATLSG